MEGEKYREFTYDGQFSENILVVRRKTTFIQKLGKNKLFGGDITDVFWVSKIILTKDREDFIRDSFEDQEVRFSYPHDLDDFNYLVGNFMQDKSEYIDNELGEQLKVNKLIIMDDVSGLADKSEELSNFLTVSRNYGFSCLYVFYTIYPGRQSWEMIMSQTHIFNFIPGSIHSSRILKTLSLFASWQKNTYLPNQQVWLNNFYFQISNSKEKRCLTIDTRDVNELGQRKFRTSACNREVQTCYFNRNKSDTHFTSFVASRTKDKQSITFSFVKVNSDFNLVNKSLDIELKNSLFNGGAKRQLQQTSTEDLSNGRRLASQSLVAYSNNKEDINQTTETEKLEKNQDFSLQAENEIVNRHRVRYTATRIKYSPTRIKSRNFLSNISYTRINKSDFYNESFILDVYVLLVKNLNPFSLQRKVSDKLKHEMVYMLWRECIAKEFYRYIC